MSLPRLVDGQRSWSLQRDGEGYREYRLVLRVESSTFDGPRTVLKNTTGLPKVGQPWRFDNDYDPWVWCRPEVSIRPVYSEGEPNSLWNLEYTFSNKPLQLDRCQTYEINDPFLEPARISGSFVKKSEEITTDANGDAIRNSAHEIIRGPQVEFEFNHPSIKIVQNVPRLDLNILADFIDTVNRFPLWGVPPGGVRLAGIHFEKKYYGFCIPYYSRTLDFEIKWEYSKNITAFEQWFFGRSAGQFLGWDREIMDEGTKALNGRWDNLRAWVIEPINGMPPDRRNPSHFKKILDSHGQPIRVLLDGKGVPVTAAPIELSGVISGTGCSVNITAIKTVVPNVGKIKTVSLGGGSGAVVTVTLNANGSVTGVTTTPVNRGRHYPHDALGTLKLSLTSGGGQGAVVTASTDSSGIITSFDATPASGGSGYAPASGSFNATTDAGGAGSGYPIGIANNPVVFFMSNKNGINPDLVPRVTAIDMVTGGLPTYHSLDTPQISGGRLTVPYLIKANNVGVSDGQIATLNTPTTGCAVTVLPDPSVVQTTGGNGAEALFLLYPNTASVSALSRIAFINKGMLNKEATGIGGAYVQDGGYGYSKGDILTVAQGIGTAICWSSWGTINPYVQPAQLTVTDVDDDDGSILAVAVSSAGQYYMNSYSSTEYPYMSNHALSFDTTGGFGSSSGFKVSIGFQIQGIRSLGAGTENIGSGYAVNDILFALGGTLLPAGLGDVNAGTVFSCKVASVTDNVLVIKVTNFGAGYTVAPSVVLTGGTMTSAYSARVQVIDGEVRAVVVYASGTWTVLPTGVTFDGGDPLVDAEATVSTVNGVPTTFNSFNSDLVSPGNSYNPTLNNAYSVLPTYPYTVSPASGNGQGALLNLVAGEIDQGNPLTNIKYALIVENGSGYQNGDTLTINNLIFYDGDIPAEITIKSVDNNGGITSLLVTNNGLYMVNPAHIFPYQKLDMTGATPGLAWLPIYATGTDPALVATGIGASTGPAVIPYLGASGGTGGTNATHSGIINGGGYQIGDMLTTDTVASGTWTGHWIVQPIVRVIAQNPTLTLSVDAPGSCGQFAGPPPTGITFNLKYLGNVANGGNGAQVLFAMNIGSTVASPVAIFQVRTNAQGKVSQIVNSEPVWCEKTFTAPTDSVNLYPLSVGTSSGSAGVPLFWYIAGLKSDILSWLNGTPIVYQGNKDITAWGAYNVTVPIDSKGFLTAETFVSSVNITLWYSYPTTDPSNPVATEYPRGCWKLQLDFTYNDSTTGTHLWQDRRPFQDPPEGWSSMGEADPGEKANKLFRTVGDEYAREEDLTLMLSVLEPGKSLKPGVIKVKAYERRDYTQLRIPMKL